MYKANGELFCYGITDSGWGSVHRGRHTKICLISSLLSTKFYCWVSIMKLLFTHPIHIVVWGNFTFNNYGILAWGKTIDLHTTASMGNTHQNLLVRLLLLRKKCLRIICNSATRLQTHHFVLWKSSYVWLQQQLTPLNYIDIREEKDFLAEYFLSSPASKNLLSGGGGGGYLWPLEKNSLYYYSLYTGTYAYAIIYITTAKQKKREREREREEKKMVAARKSGDIARIWAGFCPNIGTWKFSACVAPPPPPPTSYAYVTPRISDTLFPRNQHFHNSPTRRSNKFHLPLLGTSAAQHRLRL